MSVTERFLGGVERVGNKLPDPAFIFVWFIGALIIGSLIAAWLGAAAVNPVTGEAVAAQSLLSSENIRRLFVEMPHTLTSFAPLGYVLVVMLGAGVADRSAEEAGKAGAFEDPNVGTTLTKLHRFQPGGSGRSVQRREPPTARCIHLDPTLEQ
jgi:hypothetical protein